jgi:hypothetical protein
MGEKKSQFAFYGNKSVIKGKKGSEQGIQKDR